MARSGSGKFIALVCVWLAALGAGAAAYRFLLAPKLEEERIRRTSSEPQLATSRPTRRVRLALDSFSGYSFLRSDTMREELLREGVEVEFVDDKANYAARLAAVARGDTPLAVFTIDALIKTSAQLGKLPGTIILLLDESRGADAMVAFREAVPDIDALNRPDARIVATRDSPSETLARVVLSRFELPRLREDSWIAADGAGDAYRRIESADRSLPHAYVLWEPYVSRILEDSAVHVLIDTRGMEGKIVDVLIVEREFLLEHEDIVTSVVTSYLRTVYAYRAENRKVVGLVMKDAKSFGENITEEQAARLVGAIWWKNTIENYAHMGLLQDAAAKGLQHIERMIQDIAAVLVDTGAIDRDPTGGRPNQLYYRGILSALSDAGFHPARGGIGGAAGDDEAIREQPALKELTADECSQLVPVGTLKLESINFRTGSAGLSPRSERTLETLARDLESWPNYYLMVRGHARALGDNPAANRLLARQRAQAAAEYLERQEVRPSRLCVIAVEPKDAREEFQSVSFALGQLPY